MRKSRIYLEDWEEYNMMVYDEAKENGDVAENKSVAWSGSVPACSNTTSSGSGLTGSTIRMMRRFQSFGHVFHLTLNRQRSLIATRWQKWWRGLKLVLSSSNFYVFLYLNILLFSLLSIIRKALQWVKSWAFDLDHWAQRAVDGRRLFILRKRAELVSGQIRCSGQRTGDYRTYAIAMAKMAPKEGATRKMIWRLTSRSSTTFNSSQPSTKMPDYTDVEQLYIIANDLGLRPVIP